MNQAPDEKKTSRNRYQNVQEMVQVIAWCKILVNAGSVVPLKLLPHCLIFLSSVRLASTVTGCAVAPTANKAL